MIGAYRVRGLVRDSPHRVALCAFLVWCFVAFLYFRHVSARDPTSVFFDPEIGFQPIYSTYRANQAERFIAQSTGSRTSQPARGKPRIAVGIATVQRQGHRYFRTALGSVLEGLHPQERDSIHLTTFIANADPRKHQAFNESWIHELSDRVLTYQNASSAVRASMAALEKTDIEHRLKPMLDYIYLLEACYDTGAPHLLILEDDVIAMDGWYQRTIRAIEQLEATGDIDKTVYTRLFYNTGLQGWNSEEWPSHLLFSLFVTAVVFICIRLLQRYSFTCAKFLDLRATFVILFFCTPAVIGLYFAAGRLTVSPLRPGLVRMDTHGCCSQAFLFPRYRIPELIQYYKSRGSGFIDMLTEDYSNEHGLARWAVVPSLFQHVGASSSKGDDTSEMKWQRNIAQNIWNHNFELYDSARLREEHRAAGTSEG